MSPFERLRGAHLTDHPVLEDLIFSLLSIVVLMIAVFAITSPGHGTLSAIVTPAHAATPSWKTIYLYGTLVDTNGQPISGATVSIDYRDGKKAATTQTATDGTWRVAFMDGPGPYSITVTTIVNGTPVTGTVDITASPDMQWGVQMTFSNSSSWTFVPLPGY